MDTRVESYHDMLVLEPTRTDWSSADKIFDTRAMVTELKNSQASEMIVQMRAIATSAMCAQLIVSPGIRHASSLSSTCTEIMRPDDTRVRAIPRHSPDYPLTV